VTAWQIVAGHAGGGLVIPPGRQRTALPELRLKEANMRTSRFMITGAAVVALLSGGAAAGAAAVGPIDSSGVIHGCYYPANTNGSRKIVLQNTGTNCPRGTSAIKWNRTGPAGPAGPAGPPGIPGVSQAYTYYRVYPAGAGPEIPPAGSSPQSMDSLSLPAGAYQVSATVNLANTANFFGADNHRFIQCQLSPAPDIYHVRIDGADTDSHQATLSINVAFGDSSQPVTANLDCMALDGGSDQSWVNAQTVRLTAVALNDVSPQ
jgi:hypothetical protein